MNNNTPARSVGAPISFANSGAGVQSVPLSHNAAPHLLSQSKPQTQAPVPFPGHFQLSEPHAQVLSHSQQVHPAHVRFQPQIQSANHPITQLQAPVSGNVVLSSPSGSTPATAGTKRASHKPPSKAAGGSGNANLSSPFKTMELAPAPDRKRPKLSEKQIPEKVAAKLPESALYAKLLEYEARVDNALSRKRMDFQEALKNPPRIRKTLRLYVFNTFENQGLGFADKPAAELPSWSLKIVGRILEEGKDPVLEGLKQKSYPKFSSYFKKITIILDQGVYPEKQVVLWDSSRSTELHDGFEVKRKGDKEFNAVIRLEMNHTPEKFKIPSALSEILGIEVETRARILMAIWHYVKSNKLQNPNDTTSFICDPPLRRLFGEEKMKFAMVAQKISQHLTTPLPIHLEHTIKLSGNSPTGTSCYDVDVDVPFPVRNEISTFLEKTGRQKEIDGYDKTISDSIKKIQEHCRRRAFFLGFSHSPAEFISTLIASQSKDLKLVAGDTDSTTQDEDQKEFYNQPWVEDAVQRYLNRKTGGGDAAGTGRT
ncbi:SWI/SNF complex component SNF12 homolog [Linum perenne]